MLCSSSWGQLQSLIDSTAGIQISSVRIANRNHQRWHKAAETARPPPNRHESAGLSRTAGKPGEVLCCDSLNKAELWGDEAWRTRKGCKASCAGRPHCPLCPLHSPSKQHVSSHESCLSETPLESVSADISRNFHSAH